MNFISISPVRNLAGISLENAAARASGWFVLKSCYIDPIDVEVSRLSLLPRGSCLERRSHMKFRPYPFFTCRPVSGKGKSSCRGRERLPHGDGGGSLSEIIERAPSGTRCIAINYLTKAARPLRLHYVGQLVVGAFHGAHSYSANGDRLRSQQFPRIPITYTRGGLASLENR